MRVFLYIEKRFLADPVLTFRKRLVFFFSRLLAFNCKSVQSALSLGFAALT
jgi:hypothetical protein